MKDVLIVSPHFPPVNAPDMQRVRLALPHLARHGWRATVLALEPESVEGAVIDPLLEQTYPEKTRIIRVRGLSPRLTRPFGFGSIWWRCGRAFRKAGEELLQSGGFDLVFFSTTQFDFFTLAPLWRVAFGVPYVLDFQDPWVNDYYRRTGTRPPGGRFRYALAHSRAVREEPKALRGAAHVISVSPGYLDDFSRRYAWFDRARASVHPFGASAADLGVAAANPPLRPLIDWNDGRRHLVYTGRAGPDMEPALRILFRALRRHVERNPAADRLHFWFIGTSYAPGSLAKPTVAPIAAAENVDHLVTEHCHRVPYFEALHYQGRADAILAIGSDDRSYNASKLAGCLLAGRPALALYREGSPALGFVRRTGGARAIGFGSDDESAVTAVAAWLAEGMPADSARPEELARITAESTTAALARTFDAALVP